METGDLEISYQRPKLYPKQEAAMFDDARYSVIEATTKAGKSWSGIVWLAEQAIVYGKPGRNFWWVAPIFPTAEIAFKRMKLALTGSIIEVNETKMTITFPNGGVIQFKSGERPDALYGDDVYAVVIDEASRCREEAWHAIRSTLTKTRGRCRIIGNVKGRKNWAYKMARRAEAGEKDMAYHKITWKDAVAAGILELAEIEDAKRQLPERVFRQLYEAEAADDEGNPFGLDAIRRCIIEKPSMRPVKCWGWDLAKSVDWTVGICLDAKGHMARPMARWQKPWRESRRMIAEATAGKAAMVDSTGVGNPIVEDLQSIPGACFEGFVFTSNTKQMLVENLAVAIQSGNVGLTDQTLINELESFEYEYTATGVRYSAPEGMHDDCVMALALAVKKLGPIGRGGFAFETGRGAGGESSESDEQGRPTDPWERGGRGWEGRDYNLV